MLVGLSFSNIYQDTDLVEFEVSAWNGTFGGVVALYAGQDELGRIAERLRGFPSFPSDKRSFELGTFEPNSVGGGAKLNFAIVDAAGHVQLDLLLQDGSWRSSGQCVRLFARVEPASIDRFIQELVAVNSDNRNTAVLMFDGGTNIA